MGTTDTPTLATPVGELVAHHPARSRVFDSFGIDYCCGGKEPLQDACIAKGLDPQDVLSTLLAAETTDTGGEPAWTEMSLSELADHIEHSHHAYLKQELPRLEALVRKVAAVHGLRHPWLLEIEGVYAGFQGEINAHTIKEEQMVFPLIRRLEAGASRNPDGASTSDEPDLAAAVAVMEHEHEDVGTAMARMRALSDGFTPPPGACNSFHAMLEALRELEADLHTHVHKENNILFPRALALR